MRDTIVRYIENQAEHHKKRSFESEFQAMLEKMEISFRPDEIFD
jgi:hypothetical protein